MPKQLDPFKGVVTYGEGLTLVDIWTGLHSDAQMWQRSAFAADTLRQRAAVNENTTALLTSLNACEAVRWRALLDAQGVTQLGAIALSWCDGAALPDVATLVLQDITSPSDIDRRAASYLNPALVPETRSLSAMADAANNDAGVLVLMCLARDTPIDFDVSYQWLDGMPPAVGAVFLERYAPEVSAVDAKIVANWQAAA